MVRRQLAVGAAVLGSVAALGVPLGLLWWVIAPRPTVTVAADGGTVPLPVSETMFASEGYFALMALCLGVATGYGAYLVQYRLPAHYCTDLRLACLLGLTAGAVAGPLIAWQLGTGLDSEGFTRALAEAEPGDEIEAGLRLRALGILVVWPFAAVMQYALFDALSLWRRDLPHRSRAGGSESESPKSGGDRESESGPAVS